MMPPSGLRQRRSARASAIAPEQRADASAACTAAVALLARRDYAAAELRALLRSRGFDEEVAVAVVAHLAAERTVDDQRFAHNYVTWHAGRGQGPVRIAAELRARGVPEALIDAALAAGPDWAVLARRVRAARFGQRPPRSWPDKARQARFLQYRGFSADHIRSATGADPEREEPA